MLTASEFVMNEPLPLYRVQEAIFEFCRAHADVVVFGAQAVNAHVALPRMSQDVDLLAPDPRATAEELAAYLTKTLHFAARVREVRPGIGYRVYQTRKDGPRHLADVRLAEVPLDDAVERGGVRFTSVTLTVAMKVIAFAKRRQAPKGATDLADLRRLLLAAPALRSSEGPVAEMLARIGADDAAKAAWQTVVLEPIVSDEDADEGY